jgi:hypothetical protein
MGGDGVSESGWHISRGGKTYGALSDKEFRLLIEKGGVKTDDLIWRPGFEGWREAETVLSLSNPPPIPTKAAIPPARRRRVWKWGLVASIATAVVAALYVASPYYTLWRLKHAIENKDGLALESLVNWPRIREQTKSEILAASVSRPRYVRYSAQSGYSLARFARPLCAISGHRPALA